VGALCAVVAAAAVATAQPPGDGAVARPLDPRAEQVIAETMSPYCPGSTLTTCTSPQAESLRVAVRARIAAGETPASVRAGLVSAFGDQVRGAPAPAGFGLVAYLAPAVLVVVGGALLTRWLRRSTRAAAVRGAPPAAVPDASPLDQSPVRPTNTP
jgi:cytochrome c-type biogenesis protein CcmH